MAVTGVYPLTRRCLSVKVKVIFIMCTVSASSPALLLLSKQSVGKQAESTTCTTSLTALSETWSQEMLPKYIVHMRCHVMLREWTARAGWTQGLYTASLTNRYPLKRFCMLCIWSKLVQIQIMHVRPQLSAENTLCFHHLLRSCTDGYAVC